MFSIAVGAVLSVRSIEHNGEVVERLFAEHGFVGTTLRHVVSQAEVNLAAVHYHFGSKEELFRAVVARFARPVVERELGLLSQLKSSSGAG
jgi:AcrR family transcriptional regulator